MKYISFSLDIFKTFLPFVTITEGTFKGLNFLVDTGSTNCMMYQSSAMRFDEELKTDGAFTITYGLDGKEHQTLIVYGDFCFADKTSTIHFNIIEDVASKNMLSEEIGLNVDGVLGIDFMLANGWVVDLAHQRIIVLEKKKETDAA